MISVFRLSLIAALLIISLIVSPGDARAAYEFCNETSYVLESAIGKNIDQNAIETEGWERLYPGFCKNVLVEPLERGVYYIYARSLDIYSQEVKRFGGDTTLCVASEEGARFHARDMILCRENGYEKTGFLPIAVREAQWSSSFAEEERLYPTRRHAIVAGTQRLLSENGIDVGVIDGYAGRTTLNAIKAFQRAQDLRPTGIIDTALFERLIMGAKGRHKSEGLTFCNETPYILWAAVGLKTTAPRPQYESRGWIKLLPRACARALRGRLERDIYYAYAEAVDEKGARIHRNGRPLIWGADFSMCVTRTLFRIVGREACLGRNFRRALFRRVETGGALGWSEHFRETGEDFAGGNEP